MPYTGRLACGQSRSPPNIKQARSCGVFATGSFPQKERITNAQRTPSSAALPTSVNTHPFVGKETPRATWQTRQKRREGPFPTLRSCMANKRRI